MSDCKPTCVCNCGQQGCGCREPVAPRPVRPNVPTALCHLCEQRARMTNVRSAAGRVVVVLLCDTCDVARVA